MKSPARSKWEKGVQQYAIELAEEAEEKDVIVNTSSTTRLERISLRFLSPARFFKYVDYALNGR